jgi:hypothetical protein
VVQPCRSPRSAAQLTLIPAIIPAMLEYLLLTLGLFRATLRSRGDMVAENLLLRRQLAVLTRPTRKRPRLRAADKVFWMFARLVRGGWRRHLVLVTPETVVRWHRRGRRLVWRWRSGRQGPTARSTAPYGWGLSMTACSFFCSSAIAFLSYGFSPYAIAAHSLL